MISKIKNVVHTISDGSKCTIKCGESVKFTDLPPELIAVVVCNNTQNSETVHFAYAHHSISKKMASPADGISMGCCYIINPSVTKSYEVAVSLSSGAQADATADVYLVSGYLPMGRAIQNHMVPLNDTPVNFNAYSRLFFTPSSNWYALQLDSSEKGLVTLFFLDKTVNIFPLNMPFGLDVRSFILLGPDVNSTNIHIHNPMDGIFSHEFYGVGSQIVLNPMISSNATNVGSLKIKSLD